MRCRLLLPKIAVSVSQSVNLSVCLSRGSTVCDAFNAAFAKSLWPLVFVLRRVVRCVFADRVHRLYRAAAVGDLVGACLSGLPGRSGRIGA